MALSPTTPTSPDAALTTRTALVLLIALLLFTPLFRAGTTPLAALTAQLLALGLLVLALWSPRRLALTGAEAFILALLLLIPWVYLVPLPGQLGAQLTQALPGRELYRQALDLLPGATPADLNTLSLYPLASLGAGLALLLPVAVFLGTRTLDAPKLILLIKLLLAVAALQAMLGLIQYGAAQGGDFSFAVDPLGPGHRDNATGTYANRNHLAGLLAMALPMTLALLFYAVGRGSAHRTPGRWRRRAAFIGSAKGHAALLYSALAVLLILGIIFSRSRAGIALAMLGIVLAGLLFARRLGGSNVFGPAGTLTALALSFGVAIGLAPVLQRFSLDLVARDVRPTLFETTLQGAGTLLPVGSGPGTYAAVYPRFQPVEVGNFFVNRAHNDYLQWLFDAGVLGIALPLLFLALYAWQWTRVYTEASWSQARFLQVAAGIALLLLTLHEMVDYNLYTPANQVVFALLAGLFFMPPRRLDHAVPVHQQAQQETQQESQPRRRRTPDLTDPAPLASCRGPTTPPPDQIDNPFRNPAPSPGQAAGSQSQRADRHEAH